MRSQRCALASISSFLVLVVLSERASASGDEAGDDAPKHSTTRLAVLPIVLEGTKGSANISSIFNDVSASTERRLGLRMISYEEMFAAAEEGLGDRVRDCGSDTSCIASRLRPFNARLGLVVVIDFGSKPPLISLQLLDTDDGKMLQTFFGELSAENTISDSIRKTTGDLLEKAGYGLAAHVLVEVEPPNAHVVLGSGIDPDQGTPNRFTVAPGHYDVSAVLDGWKSASSAVTVGSGGEERVKLTLIKNTSLLESPWLWIGVGLAIAGGTTAAILATHKTTRCLCTVVSGKGCGCPE
jgi:hypothetical protein